MGRDQGEGRDEKDERIGRKGYGMQDGGEEGYACKGRWEVPV